MRKLSMIVAAIFFAATMSTTAFAKPATATLKQKVAVKNTVSEAEKLTKEFSKKVAELFDEIELQHLYLKDLVTESDQISDEDKELLLDLLENDPDYSWTLLNQGYTKLMGKLPKSDLKAIKALFTTSFEKYSSILENLQAYEEELPNYYTIDDDSYNTSMDEEYNDDGSSNEDDGTHNEDESVDYEDYGDI